MLHRTRGSLDSRDVWLTPHRWLLHLWTRKLALLARTLNSHWRVYIWRKNKFQSKKVHTHANIVTQESIYPVILSLKKSPPRGFPGSRKSLRPVIFRCKKTLRPVIFFIKKSLRPVIFSVQKSTRPAASWPALFPVNFANSLTSDLTSPLATYLLISGKLLKDIVWDLPYPRRASLVYL